MSTLTKILIILITFASLFLCGAVVTYIANANDYKEMHRQATRNLQSLKTENTSLKQQLNDGITSKQTLENELTQNIQSLELAKSKLEADLANTKIEASALLQRVNSWAGVVEGFNQTIADAQQSLAVSRGELDNLRAEQIKNNKELNELTATLNEKMAIVESLEAKTRRLLEEKIIIEQQFGLGDSGKISAMRSPVTPDVGRARQADPLVGDVALQAVVNSVDIVNSMVGISVGSADGVRVDSVFHITSGVEFICDIRIIEVDTKQSVGVIELKLQNPRIGDLVVNQW